MINQGITRNRFLYSLATLLSIPFAGRAASSDGLSSRKSERVVEFRTYNLKPGTREHFHDVVVNRSMPLLAKWKMDVVSYGASMHDATSYYLVRAFNSLDDWQKEEDAFYGSDDWRKGPREDILAQIENYNSFIVSMDVRTIEKLREMRPGTIVLPGH